MPTDLRNAQPHTIAEWHEAFEKLQAEYNRVRPRDAEGRPIRGDKWDDFMWQLLNLQYTMLLGLVGDGRGDSLEFLIDRLLHAAIGHGNDSDFVRKYFRREIEYYVDRERAEARDDA